jgi:uncharacterized protein YjbI with pentapeptide repeats
VAKAILSDGNLGEHTTVHRGFMNSTIPSGIHAAVNAKLTGSTFRDVCLGEARFEDVNLKGAAFHDINLAGAKFDDVNFSDVAITNANLAGMTIDGVLVSDLFAAYRRMNGS